MPLTNAQKQSRQRERTKAKLERLAVLEAALREIDAISFNGVTGVLDRSKALGEIQIRARQALAPDQGDR